MVSVASTTCGLALAASLIVSACAGRQHPFALTPRAASADSHASAVEAEGRAAVLQFDNEATVYVDVYLVAPQIQWRLGRVPAGMRATLNVPESAIDWTTGFVQLVVLPGSHVSAEVSRDPRAIIAIAQPVSELLTQRWSFRQPAGAALQLQATRLVGRQ
jgi:cellobiose-specific phosphotransferase system component IIB